MSRADEAMQRLCDEMRQYGAGADFEASLRDLMVKYRVAHERRMRDAQAADLLCLGRTVAAERLHVKPSTVYKMAHRHRERFSTPEQAA
jgi:hypothetical protein